MIFKSPVAVAVKVQEVVAPEQVPVWAIVLTAQTGEHNNKMISQRIS